jgi:hypothetical protein
MVTHHGRPGGRSGELFWLFLTILGTVALPLGGGAIALGLAHALGSETGFFAFKAGAVVGFVMSALAWRKLLTYYRYGADLKPIRSEEDET